MPRSTLGVCGRCVGWMKCLPELRIAAVGCTLIAASGAAAAGGSDTDDKQTNKQTSK